jgi:hypothetical protein
MLVTDRVCSGPTVDLAVAIVDPACAIDAAKSKSLLASLDGSVPILHQEAKFEDGRVVVSLVNGGSSAVVLPLSWHARVQAFSALAEDERHALYELDAPKLDVRSSRNSPEDDPPKAHFARIVLPPGGVASARAIPSSNVTKRIAPACRDGVAEGGTCAPPRLPPGKYVLHIGQLLVDVEAGIPAKVEWTVP